MTHSHEADEQLDVAHMFTREFWDDRYSSQARIWSGKPNARLVEHAFALEPGRALDMGCGEGADVVWLAERGWRVTGSDISPVALGRAAEHAEKRGVADRVTWLPLDLAADALPEALRASFELVNAQFLHLPDGAFERGYAALAAAVAPGGLLLVTGHHPDHQLGNPALAHLLFTPDRVTDLLAKLPGLSYEVLVASAPTRPGKHPESGEPVTFTDSVVLARRTS